MTHPDLTADAMREALETAFRRLGGIPAIVRSERGAEKIIEICVKEFIALSAPRTERDAWLPIESAPKQSKHVLLFGDGAGFMQCAYVGGWNGERWIQVFGYRAEPTFPTHWQPLPSAPVKQEGK
jgi:hypothetical protein